VAVALDLPFGSLMPFHIPALIVALQARGEVAERDFGLLLLGAAGVLVALGGLFWAGRADGTRAVPQCCGNDRRRSLLAAAVLFALFLLLAAVIRVPALEQAEQQLVDRFYRSGGRDVTGWMKQVAELGSNKWMYYVGAGVAVLLALLRRARSIRFFLAAMIGAPALEAVFKTLIGRDRPGESTALSFPSGHALAATVLCATLLLLLLPACRRVWQRVLLGAAAATWFVLICVSRVYLGKHYPTDVLGGILLGLAWTAAAVGLVRGFSRSENPR
jgi:undecaprenyl-diphosphatase